MPSLITKVYRPSMTVGQLYARVWGSTAAFTPVGNVLSLTLSHEEDVQRQPDMTALGGGTYAKVSRVNQATLEMELADWNAVNFARGVFGTATLVAAGSVTAEPHVAKPGGLVRLLHPLDVDGAITVKVGDPLAALVDAERNVEPRPEGLWIREDADEIAPDDDITVDYEFPEYVNVEALTQSAAELELSFAGLNEADSGKPFIVDVWRASQGLAQSLALINSQFAALTVTAELLSDPNKSGVGISRFYRARMV
jgi:hypothetical protein